MVVARCLVSIVGLSLILSACSLVRVRGEFGETECRNGDDDDGDGLKDCADPDCAAHTFCRHPDAGPSDDLDPRPPTMLGEATSQELPEPAGASGAMMALDAAMPAAELPDASGQPAPSTPPDAPDTTCEQRGDCPAMPDPCDAGACGRPEGQTTQWRITGVHVTVPLAIDGDCLDSSLECLPPLDLPPFRACGCLPDPWVSIKVDGKEVMHTEASVNTDRADWSARVGLTLAASSELRFDVMDRDVLTDEPIYTCSVSAADEDSAADSFGCSATFIEKGEEVAYSVQIDVTPDN